MSAGMNISNICFLQAALRINNSFICYLSLTYKVRSLLELNKENYLSLSRPTLISHSVSKTKSHAPDTIHHPYFRHQIQTSEWPGDTHPLGCNTVIETAWTVSFFSGYNQFGGFS